MKLARMIWVLILAVALAACSSGSGKSAARSQAGIAHVHGLGVDPSDGALYAATHDGLFRLGAGGDSSRVGTHQDTMGFTVVGPHNFLGSGHPGMGESGPPLLGLIETTDSGATWNPQSLSGEVDFHALHVTPAGSVYGFDSRTSRLMVSTDKKSWTTLSHTPMLDFAVSPRDPKTVIATTQQGPTRSSDGGRNFAPLAGAPLLTYLAWSTAGDLFGLGVDGTVHLSTDSGENWTRVGSVAGRPEALAVQGTNLFAATDATISQSDDRGASWTVRYGLQS